VANLNNIELVKAILSKYGHRKGNRIIAEFSRQSKFVDALASDVGQLLLKDSIDKMDSILTKIINEEADERDRAEYRVLKSILDVWCHRVDTYTKTLNGGNE